MRFLPMALDLHDQHCLVVGGGSVGTRKALTLARAGALVTVVSPQVTDELAAHIGAGRITWIEARFRAEHVRQDYRLVVMATDDSSVNVVGARTAAEQNVLACAASSMEDSRLIFGALLQRDGVTVAVFTDGRDPARAARVRDSIASLLDDEGEGARPR
jgi:uroporphyrin-III C-methyltransferase / precorrin-2 dehydrogenase / sirohydrochlorin ferrochelatase